MKKYKLYVNGSEPITLKNAKQILFVIYGNLFSFIQVVLWRSQASFTCRIFPYFLLLILCLSSSTLSTLKIQWKLPNSKSLTRKNVYSRIFMPISLKNPIPLNRKKLLISKTLCPPKTLLLEFVFYSHGKTQLEFWALLSWGIA